MKAVSVAVARELAWDRLLEEIALCQDLCNFMDEKIDAYLTVLGRMAYINLAKRIHEVPSSKRASVFRIWGGDAQYYGPFVLLTGAKGESTPASKTRVQNELKNVADFLYNKTLLDPKYPWGVLMLGGLMRAYAEMSEFIHDNTPAPSVTATKGWQYRRKMENEGRLSWQRNLISAYNVRTDSGGYDLFGKLQIKAEKNQPVIAKAGKIKKINSREKGDPTKDRMRFQRPILQPEYDKNLGLVTFDTEYKKLQPFWTRSGRLGWQTFTRDRISLVGDVYGLMRGATISGTTSDHAYSFWQLCNDIKLLNTSSNDYKDITAGETRSSHWNKHTTEELQAAVATIKTDKGFAQIVRMMMLVPITQMGLEMHHSVHEMASVVGLNDIINWSAGYYDTMFMTLRELKVLEAQYLAKWKGESIPKDTSIPRDSSKLGQIEAQIKAKLTAATNKVCHGYFVTLDPHLFATLPTPVTLNDSDWGGVVMEGSEIVLHKKNALVDQKILARFNQAIISDISKTLITDKGITKAFIEQHRLGGNTAPAVTITTTRGIKIGQRPSSYNAPAITKIVNDGKAIWQRYRRACEVRATAR